MIDRSHDLRAKFLFEVFGTDEASGPGWPAWQAFQGGRAIESGAQVVSDSLVRGWLIA